MAGIVSAVLDRLLFVSDLHFWKVIYNPLELVGKPFLGNLNVVFRRRHEFVMERALPFAGALAKTGIRTVLIGGDFTSTGHRGEFAMAAAFVGRLQQLGLQVCVIPGNHDVYTRRMVRERRFEEYLGGWYPPQGLPARVLLPGGTPLVLVPTVCPNLLSSKGRITDGEAAATRKMIEGCPPGPVLAGGHYPVLHRTAGYASSAGRRLRNAGALGRALGESGREILYLAGHVHRFSLTRDAQYGQVLHHTTGAFFQQREEGEGALWGGFSEVHVLEEGFAVYAWRNVGGTWRREAMGAT